jgi:hypothetical protein
MTEQTTPFASMGYRQVPGLANRLIARYLRSQRKNMRRLFQERGLYKLAERMNQIRNSRQGMLAKIKMFQEVLNPYAQQSMPARPDILESQEEQMHNVRQDSIQIMEKGESGEVGVTVHGVAEGKPREAKSDSEQALQISDTYQTDIE